MAGKIRIVDRYSREQIMEDPETLYVFGDNLERTGYGGQAGAARDCPNAIGIPTLFAPGRPATPEWISLFRAVAATEIQTLYLHLMSGGDIVWPADGVGTGIADLRSNCPELLDYIENYMRRLTSTFGRSYEEDGYPYRGAFIDAQDGRWRLWADRDDDYLYEFATNDEARRFVDTNWKDFN